LEGTTQEIRQKMDEFATKMAIQNEQFNGQKQHLENVNLRGFKVKQLKFRAEFID
jgi:hypothetical protein